MFVVFYEAIRDFFRRTTWAGQEIPVVFASPDRAHQEMRRVLQRRRAGTARPGISVTERADEDRPMPVPFMSLWILSPRYNPRYFNPGTFVVSKNIQSSTAVVARYPMPIQADIQVDLWCGSEAGHRIAQTIEPQIELKFFGGHLALPIDWELAKWYKPPFNVVEHAKYLGRTGLRLYTRGWRNTSDLEIADGQKQVRDTWSGYFEATIPYRAEEARVVTSIEVEVRDALTDELFATYGSSSEEP